MTTENKGNVPETEQVAKGVLNHSSHNLTNRQSAVNKKICANQKKGKRGSLLLAHSAFCLKDAFTQVNSCWANKCAVSASCAVVRVEFSERVEVHLVE